MAVQFNYLQQKGAFVYRNGAWDVDQSKIRGAVRDLAHDLLTLEATGDYAGAKKMLDTLGSITPDIAATLGNVKSVPVDIGPIFLTANQFAPDNR
jgi:hypothetical protein